jgi:hypothetical protein
MTYLDRLLQKRMELLEAEDEAHPFIIGPPSQSVATEWFEVDV